MPKIGFVVPVYKVKEEFLRYCVNSLINQTMHDIEIVLVDDYSPDKCGKICDEIANQDKRIKVIHHEQNRGLPNARNTGIVNSDSEWLAFIDSDDWVDLDMAEKLSNEIEKNYADIYIYSGYREFKQKTQICTYIYPHGKEFVTPNERNELEKRFLIDQSKHKIVGSFPLQSACIKLVNRKLFVNGLRFVDVRFAEDGLFHLYSIEMAEKVIYLQYNFYHYRDTFDSMVNGYRENAIQEQKSYLSEVWKFADIYNKDVTFKKSIYFITFLSMQFCVWQKLFNKKYKKNYIQRQIESCRVFSQWPYKGTLHILKMRDLSRNQWPKYILFKMHFYTSAKKIRSIYKHLIHETDQ